jgi:hypothetical protein
VQRQIRTPIRALSVRPSSAYTQRGSRLLRLLWFLLFLFLPVAIAHCQSPLFALMDNCSVFSARRIAAIAVLPIA